MLLGFFKDYVVFRYNLGSGKWYVRTEYRINKVALGYF